MKFPDRQRRDEVQRRIARNDELTIRLALAGRELGEGFVIGDAGRGGQTRLLEYACANFFAVADAVYRPRRSCVTSR